MVRHAGFLDAKSDNLTVAAAGATRAPDVVLARGASLTVRVERPDGRPSEGADVSLDLDTEAEVDWDPFGGIGSPDERQTKADGTATWPHLAAGEGTVTATAKGFAPGRATVAVPEAAATTQTVRVTIHLRPAVRLVGRVLDPDDRPIAGARLTLSQPEAVEDDAGWMPTRYATSDAEGRFAIDDVPGLRAMLATGAEGFGAQSMEVTPGLGDIVVRMTPEDPGVAAQLEALEAELMTLYQQIGEATDAESRQALFARIQVIQEQKEKLEKGDR